MWGPAAVVILLAGAVQGVVLPVASLVGAVPGFDVLDNAFEAPGFLFTGTAFIGGSQLAAVDVLPSNVTRTVVQATTSFDVLCDTNSSCVGLDANSNYLFVLNATGLQVVSRGTVPTKTVTMSTIDPWLPGTLQVTNGFVWLGHAPNTYAAYAMPDLTVVSPALGARLTTLTPPGVALFNVARFNPWLSCLRTTEGAYCYDLDTATAQSSGAQAVPQVVVGVALMVLALALVVWL